MDSINSTHGLKINNYKTKTGSWDWDSMGEVSREHLRGVVRVAMIRVHCIDVSSFQGTNQGKKTFSVGPKCLFNSNFYSPMYEPYEFFHLLFWKDFKYFQSFLNHVVFAIDDDFQETYSKTTRMFIIWTRCKNNYLSLYWSFLSLDSLLLKNKHGEPAPNNHILVEPILQNS